MCHVCQAWQRHCYLFAYVLLYTLTIQAADAQVTKQTQFLNTLRFPGFLNIFFVFRIVNITCRSGFAQTVMEIWSINPLSSRNDCCWHCQLFFSLKLGVSVSEDLNQLHSNTASCEPKQMGHGLMHPKGNLSGRRTTLFDMSAWFQILTWSADICKADRLDGFWLHGDVIELYLSVFDNMTGSSQLDFGSSVGRQVIQVIWRRSVSLFCWINPWLIPWNLFEVCCCSRILTRITFKFTVSKGACVLKSEICQHLPVLGCVLNK